MIYTPHSERNILVIAIHALGTFLHASD